MNFTAYAASVSQRGHANEDAFLIDRAVPLMAVFDGEGNAENAAKKAARQLERLCKEYGSNLDLLKAAKLLDSYLLGVNRSTMVAARLDKDVVTICSVGDSRAYLVRDGQASILTEGTGKQKLGSGAIQPLIKQVAAKDRDVLLLMTDGIWTRYSLYTLARVVVSQLSLPELPTVLLEQAAKGGVYDDMTVVVITVRR